MNTTMYAASSTPDLIRHIVTVHHEFLRTEIARVDRHLDGIVGPGGPEAERIASLASRWSSLARELLEHQDLEEREIFPAIERAPECVSGLGPVAIITRAAYVDKLVHDHRSIVQGLDDVRARADDYVAPPDASAGLRELYRALARLDEGTRAHLRKETEALFPRLVSCLN